MAGMTPSWTRRLFEWFGTGTIGVGVGLALSLILVFLLQEAALGRLSWERFGDIWTTIVHVLIASYLLGAYTYCEQSRDRTIESLRPLLDEDRIEPIFGSERSNRWSLAIWSVLGLATSFVFTLYITPGPASYDPASWSPESGWHRVLGPIMGLWTARLSGSILIEARKLSELALTLPEIDLLDSARLHPFARQALTNALLVIGTVSVYALFIVDDIGYWTLVVSMLVASLVVGGLALLLPLRGVRDRVQEAKRKELAWCRERMRLARRQLAGEGNAERGHLEELVAWEARIESVSEWTLDASTFARFALYLLIPIGSWAGGALVERVVDSMLD
jgi:hypothetical protein